MRYLVVSLAMAAFASGVIAARYWYKASKVHVIPMWEEYEQMKPVDPSQSAAHWIVATVETIRKAGALNVRAATWTAISITFGALSSVLSTFSN